MFHRRPADRPQGKRASCVSFLHSKPGSQQAAGLCLPALDPFPPAQKGRCGNPGPASAGLRPGRRARWMATGGSLLSPEEPQAATWAALRRPLRPALPVSARHRSCGLPGLRGAAGVSPSVARRRGAAEHCGQWAGPEPCPQLGFREHRTWAPAAARRLLSLGPGGLRQGPAASARRLGCSSCPLATGPPRRRSLEGSGDSALRPGSPPQRSQKLWTESASAEPPVAACLEHRPRSEGFLGVVAAAFQLRVRGGQGWCWVLTGSLGGRLGTSDKEKGKVPPRFELGSLDSESRVLTITPWNRPSAPAVLLPDGTCLLADGAFLLGSGSGDAPGFRRRPQWRSLPLRGSRGSGDRPGAGRARLPGSPRPPAAHCWTGPRCPRRCARSSCGAHGVGR